MDVMGWKNISLEPCFHLRRDIRCAVTVRQILVGRHCVWKQLGFVVYSSQWIYRSIKAEKEVEKKCKRLLAGTAIRTLRRAQSVSLPAWALPKKKRRIMFHLNERRRKSDLLQPDKSAVQQLHKTEVISALSFIHAAYLVIATLFLLAFTQMLS